MTIIGESSLDEYARAFYERERWKNEEGKRDWDLVKGGADPVALLSRPKEEGGHPYKMPRQQNNIIRIALLNQQDVESLIIHDYMLHDKDPGGRWIRERVEV